MVATSHAFLGIDLLIIMIGVKILKKILLTCFMCLSSNLFALCDKNEVIDSLVVKITNATGADCVLEKNIATNGYISDPILFPEALLDKQTVVITMKPYFDQRTSTMCGYRRKSILLAYRCGEDRSATFFTDTIPFQGMLETDATIIRANKLALVFKETYNESGRFQNNAPVMVEWTLLGKSF
jgi:hypothetical protein